MNDVLKTLKTRMCLMKSEDSEDKVFEDSEDITSKERVLKILKIVSAEQRSWNAEDWILKLQD